VAKKPKADTLSQTLDLIKQGKSMEEIATARGMALGTVLDHVLKISKLHP
jgi:DNA-binding CsgD family transcriptional regulator